MRVSKLRVSGFRAFNDEQTVELDGKLVIYWGANGTGKTSIGEGLEWLLYGRTLKRVRGDEISKREYAESYRNAHYAGTARPFVEAEFVDDKDQRFLIRRELYDDERSLLTVNGTEVADLRNLGINTPYDRPLILQHTLQDFIFMKPKTRYEVLSSMLGLEGLLSFRNAVEEAKGEFPKRLPKKVQDALTRSATVRQSLQGEPLLAPVAVAISRGNLEAARKQVVAIALGRVAPGTNEADLIPALQAAQASAERAQLDWGRFSLGPISSPDTHPAITELALQEKLVQQFHEQIAAAATVAAGGAESTESLKRQDFVRLGLDLVDPDHATRCPFCLEETLTSEKLAELRKQLAGSQEGNKVLAEALATLQEVQGVLRQHSIAVARLLPNFPSEVERDRIKELGADARQHVDAYNQTCQTLEELSKNIEASKRALEKTIQSTLETLQAAQSGEETATIATSWQNYAGHVRSIPSTANAYAATYATLDPYIKTRLGSASEVRLLKQLANTLRSWADIELTQNVEAITKTLQELIRQTRQFIAKKQTEILGGRDKEIRNWYDLMNPGADVGYHQMVPGTDSLELQARSFSKVIMAAPHLSACQLNCLGLAVYLACATRVGTPHRMLLIDDPIQSMDDDHTEAFKLVVLKELLKRGFQVILLTHMDNFADAVEKLYRASANAVLYRFEGYTKSGPSITSTGPEIKRLLDDVRKNKDAVNENFRSKANLDLRKFVERFAKDFYTSETGKSVSKTYEDTSWGELRKLLRQCTKFEPADEPVLEDTHTFTSKHLHTGASAPAKVPSSAHLNPHYTAMKGLLEKYKALFGVS
jgi:hypothetical protein